LSRTPASAGNRRTWTWSGWVKRSALGASASTQRIFSSGSYGTYIRFVDTRDYIQFESGTSGATLNVITNQVFRDTGAWFHLVVSLDTTQATAADRVKFWINGVQVTSFLAASYPSQNVEPELNSAALHTISSVAGSSEFLGGYLTNIHFIDGQALTPASFAETDATTGAWNPKAYTGTYGTNGFYLQFADNSSNTASTLGKDYSGLGNNWTPNNFSVLTGGPTSVAAASGALPIFNTTDTYGAVKGTGTRTDTNSASIVLAVPMDGTNGGTSFGDQSAVIKGSGSAKTVTVTSAITSTSQSKFYGSSGYFNGSSSLSLSSTSDFDFNSVNYTIELWFYVDASTVSPHSRLFEFSGAVHAAYIYSDRTLYVKGGNVGGTGDISFPAGSYNSNAWNHLAIVGLTDGTRLAFLNGSMRTASGGGNPSGAQSLAINGDTGGSYRWTGYISDFRVYKSVAKYTGNFNPPSSTANPTIAAGNDSLIDSPTNYGTDTGVGGEVRGNYCTWNAVNKSANTTLSNGNLNATSAVADWRAVLGTIGMTSGKWYWEQTITGSALNMHGIAKQGVSLESFIGVDANGWGYYGNSGTYNNSNLINTSTFASYTGGDIIGIAFDADNGSLYFYKNGTVQNSGSPAYTGLTSGPYFPAASHFNSSSSDVNFGQRAFAYQTPGTNRPAATYKALCTQNLPAPLVTKSNTVFDVVKYDGNSGSQAITLPGGFSPDLVWLKSRSNAYYNHLIDTARGSDKVIWSNLTNAEQTSNTEITSFNTDGFTLGSGTGVNGSGSTYVGWCWKGIGNPSTSSTTINANAYSAGVPSITSQVRANATAGFSVVTYTGNAISTATVGHGLGVSPSLIITKSRSNSSNWGVYHSSIGPTQYLLLNSTSAAQTSSSPWNNTAPTSTVFSIGDASFTNTSGDTYVGYAFAPVVGYSAMGSYVGNGSATDGPFVYTGMRPRWILIKSATETAGWMIYDTARDTYNQSITLLYPNLSLQEQSSSNYAYDILSNGFKVRNSGQNNTSSATYIYAAFAEAPFNYSRAR
jgi:hypothetical protein